ncbi:hypothetical protein HHI36_012077, partial [Cryptolaemus montrouzieri]
IRNFANVYRNDKRNHRGLLKWFSIHSADINKTVWCIVNKETGRLDARRRATKPEMDDSMCDYPKDNTLPLENYLSAIYRTLPVPHLVWQQVPFFFSPIIQ